MRAAHAHIVVGFWFGGERREYVMVHRTSSRQPFVWPTPPTATNQRTMQCANIYNIYHSANEHRQFPDGTSLNAHKTIGNGQFQPQPQPQPNAVSSDFGMQFSC